MSSDFKSISIDDYVVLHLKSNPGENPHDLKERLKRALAAAKAGARCQCGEPIWALGSAVVGNLCFTCITGEAWPSEDYEIVENPRKRGKIPTRG